MESDPLGVSFAPIDAEKLKRWSDVPPRDLPESVNFGNQEKIHQSSPFPFDENINKKVILWYGDLTKLSVQSVVNSTNETLNDRNPLSEKILARAGDELRKELYLKIKGCRTGDAKLTKGYNLPARYIIHTVGPKYNLKYQTAAESALFSCYYKVLCIVREHRLCSVAFSTINSVRRAYPPHEGAHIALRTVRRFLEKHGEVLDTIVFCVDDVDLGIYELLMPLYYPRSAREEDYALYYLPQIIGGEDGEPIIPERQIRIFDTPIQLDKKSTDEEDLAAQLDSSVCVGKTPFAKMHGDIDKRRMSNRKNPNFSADVLTSEVQRKNKYERLLRKARTEDLRDFANLHCLYHSGEDKFGRPIVVFIGYKFKVAEADMEKAILYLIQTMDPLVQQEYTIVYFHSMTLSENHPSLPLLRDVYDILEYKYKKNLQAFYIVHPTFWSKLMAWWFTTFSASSLKNKVHCLGGIEYLYSIISPDQLEVPTEILHYDYKVNGVRYYQPSIPGPSRDGL